MSGYTKLYRRLWDNAVFRNKQEAAVFAWMISAAQWREGRISTAFGPVNLGVGELLIAERVLAEDFGLHRNTLRALIQRLVDDHAIELFRDRCAHRAGTVVRIVNYTKYQSVTGCDANVEDRSGTESRTERGPNEDRSGTKNKEGNERKEGNNFPPHSPPGGGGGGDDFQRWYAAYPKHCDQGPAEREYAAARKIASADELLEAAVAFAGLCRAKGTPDQFIAKPHIWLRKKRWLDEDLRRPPPRVESTDDVKWRARLKAFSERGFWVPHLFGPEPGKPGCKAPSDLITEILKEVA